MYIKGDITIGELVFRHWILSNIKEVNLHPRRLNGSSWLGTCNSTMKTLNKLLAEFCN